MGTNKPKAIRSLARIALGPLETQIMELVCDGGQCTVRQIVDRIGHGVAYTTVMTTMDRLFHKGLLKRRHKGRGYLYFSTINFSELEAQVESDLIVTFLTRRKMSSKLLASTLLDAASEFESVLVDELEEQIRTRRTERIAGDRGSLGLQAVCQPNDAASERRASSEEGLPREKPKAKTKARGKELRVALLESLRRKPICKLLVRAKAHGLHGGKKD